MLIWVNDDHYFLGLFSLHRQAREHNPSVSAIVLGLQWNSGAIHPPMLIAL
jgi:hypothetical protein